MADIFGEALENLLLEVEEDDKAEIAAQSTVEAAWAVRDALAAQSAGGLAALSADVNVIGPIVDMIEKWREGECLCPDMEHKDCACGFWEKADDVLTFVNAALPAPTQPVEQVAWRVVCAKRMHSVGASHDEMISDRDFYNRNGSCSETDHRIEPLGVIASQSETNSGPAAKERTMPETAETTFPTEALARLRAQHEEVAPEYAAPEAILKDAMEVIEHLETDAEMLRATIGNIRLRVRDALESP